MLKLLNSVEKCHFPGFDVSFHHLVPFVKLFHIPLRMPPVPGAWSAQLALRSAALASCELRLMLCRPLNLPLTSDDCMAKAGISICNDLAGNYDRQGESRCETPRVAASVSR
jgi:hypothetical protein